MARNYVGTEDIYSGTYTPTITSQSNISAITPQECSYIKIGNIVKVFGRIDITATTANTTTSCELSLPIQSNLSVAASLVGFCNAYTTVVAAAQASNNGIIAGNGTTDNAIIRVAPSVNTVLNYYFDFSYVIE